ncbi:MAG TPA: hypothetical protein VLB87_01620, partial [Pyrinomonadaceae bacterium]|nr:hypothetical protein [Pyrinomonadaceae bacterium]
MNCQRFEQLVSELARGRMMEADLRSEALAHSEECERCVARLRDEEKLTRGLQMVAAQMETLAAPDAVELKLREAFRTRHVAAPVAIDSVADSSVTSSRSRYWLMAVAAMLLVALTVAAMWWRSDRPQQTVAEKTLSKPAETPIVPADSGGPADSIEPPHRAKNEEPKRPTPKALKRNTATRKPEAQLANHATNEIATDFMPLGDMNTIVLQDGGQIIRVK